MPLLGKELTERAARRRTYVIRVLYAVLLFGFFLMLASRYMWGNYYTVFRFGSGRQMLEMLFFLQCWGVALFLPALMSGAITLEKERDSLVLLFLTDLKSGEIILQKYLGGLVPMFTFVILSLPLGAILYSFGGVEIGDLLRFSLILFLLILQIGAMALMCSAFAKSSLGALLGTYFFGLVFYGSVPFGMAVWTSAFGRGYVDGDWMLLLSPFQIVAKQPGTVLGYVLVLAPTVLSIGAFLLLARRFLLRRAFLPTGSFLLKWFGWLDGFMSRLNRLTGGVVLSRNVADLPGEAPVAWREVTRKALGRFHYLIRCVLPVQIVVAIVCLLTIAERGTLSRQVEELSIVLLCLWALVAMVLASQGANIIVSERVHQTLEVLLTTPLSGREIVLQKMQAVRRLMIVCAIPLATVIAIEAWVEEGYMQINHSPVYAYRSMPIAAYLVCSVLSLLIYLPLIAWFAMFFGLKCRTRFRAILTALGAGAAWCFGPIFLMILLSIHFHGPVQDLLERLILISPVAIIGFNEFGEMKDLGGIWTPILLNFAAYGAALLLFRWLCLRRADQYLGRP